MVSLSSGFHWSITRDYFDPEPLVIMDAQSTRLNMHRFVHGLQWMQCRTGLLLIHHVRLVVQIYVQRTYKYRLHIAIKRSSGRWCRWYQYRPADTVHTPSSRSSPDL